MRSTAAVEARQAPAAADPDDQPGASCSACCRWRIASGPGAGSQNAIGRAVVGGALSATFLAIFFVPLFFVFVKSCFQPRQAGVASPAGAQPVPAE